MKVQAFITSGILEKYALGMTTDEENQEILERASQHLEIKEEIAAIRKTMRGYILSHQLAPPEDLRDKVLKIATGQISNRSSKREKKEPAPSSFVAAKPLRKRNGVLGYQMATAVLVVCLAGVAYVAYSNLGKLDSINSDINAAQENIQRLENENAQQKQIIENINGQLAFYHDRANEIIQLKGTNRSPAASLILYWNLTAKNASVDVVNMPNVSEGAVPVLWAVANGQSVKVGVLTANQAGQRSVVTFIPNPKSFYVTEEETADAERPNRNRILMRSLQ